MIREKRSPHETGCGVRGGGHEREAGSRNRRAAATPLVRPSLLHLPRGPAAVRSPRSTPVRSSLIQLLPRCAPSIACTAARAVRTVADRARRATAARSGPAGVPPQPAARPAGSPAKNPPVANQVAPGSGWVAVKTCPRGYAAHGDVRLGLAARQFLPSAPTVALGRPPAAFLGQPAALRGSRGPRRPPHSRHVQCRRQQRD